MKKSKITTVILSAILIAFVGFYACEKTYVEPETPSNATTDKSMLALVPAAWRIVSFQWHDRSENDHFRDYTFQFYADGSVVARHSRIKEIGKWRKKNNILQLIFNSDPLNELSNNWTIVDHTPDNASFKGLNPSDGSSEFLSIEKISSEEENL
ncbi:MAG: hypothetical protein ACXVNN_01290 [Bacteroidia bacterium]